jgi:hypothetical protein
MSTVLYYPSFEIQDENWLKFALLYLDRVETIVPHSAESCLSQQHEYILKNTDLLKNYNPTYEEGQKASDDAIQIIKQIIEDPQRYWSRIGKIHFLEYWRDLRSHNFELYHDKFSDSFMHFCRENKIYSNSNNGMLVPYEVGLIYMSLLAYSISARRKRDVITDSKDMSKLITLSNATWKLNQNEEKVIGLKSYIETKVPAGIAGIPIEKIICLRNNPKYRKSLKDFHSIVDKISDEKSLDRFNIHEIEYELEYKLKDIQADLVVNLGATLVGTALGIVLAVNSGADCLTMLKESMGVAGTAVGAVQLFKSKEIIREKHSARRFQTYLGNLQA